MSDGKIVNGASKMLCVGAGNGTSGMPGERGWGDGHTCQALVAAETNQNRKRY